MEKRRLGDLLKAVTLLKHHGLHATGITEAYHARRVAPLMVHMLSLYQMALTASLEGTMLSRELLHNSEIEQCILEAMEVNVVTFKFPITGHPVVRPDLSFIEMVCFFLVFLPDRPFSACPVPSARTCSLASSLEPPMRRYRRMRS
jgi:hypothetical protein